MNEDAPPPAAQPSLWVILARWGWIGCTGFGGPPTHIAMLRELCVTREKWLAPVEFEDAVAACNLLPGPSSTQLSIFCAYRVGGRLGGVIGGLAFILPGLVIILLLAAAFLTGAPPPWLLAAGAGAGAVIPAVAAQAGMSLVPASRGRAVANGRASTWRWAAYLAAGAVSAATVGPWLVLALLGCGALELAITRRAQATGAHGIHLPMMSKLAATTAAGTLASLSWVALKVGLFSYGGGFVIVPLMRADAVDRYHWMTAAQFLNAVALGQVTPGPLVQTVSVVGYAAAGLTGGLLATAVAFAPSFAIILLGGRHFDRIRGNQRMRAFLDGAGPAAIGAILGSGVVLLGALGQPWQFGVLAVGAAVMFALRRGVLLTILVGAVLGVLAWAAGAPLPS